MEQGVQSGRHLAKVRLMPRVAASALATAGALAGAALTFGAAAGVGGPVNQGYGVLDDQLGTSGDSSYDGTLQILAQAGFANTIHLEAQASAGTQGSATAMADPFLSIDPSTANAAQYSFRLRAGIGNGMNLPAGVSRRGFERIRLDVSP